MTVQTGTRGHVGDSFGKPDLGIFILYQHDVFVGTQENILVLQLLCVFFHGTEAL